MIFSISEEDLQHEAMERIGRQLTGDEIEIAADGIEWGISAALDATYHTVFTEMI